MTDAERCRHDFKNQLGIIRGFAELLLAETGLGDAHRRDLEEIHTAVVAALALLPRVLPAEAETAP